MAVKLTRNQRLVLDALASAGRPQSAYTLLDHLRDDGFRAPLQVYRALNKLIERGDVHKLESINSFVACAHPHGHEHEHEHGVVAFAICDQCGSAEEFADETVERHLKDWAAASHFTLTQSIIELRGVCEACVAQAPRSSAQ